jgi:hypothetical protein
MKHLAKHVLKEYGRKWYVDVLLVNTPFLHIQLAFAAF